MAKKVVKLKKTSGFSGKQIGIFAAVFAVIATFLVFSVFAATASITYNGQLSAKNPQSSYTITTGAGNLNVSLTNKSKDLALNIVDTTGVTIGTIKNNGIRKVTLDLTVAPGRYTAIVSYPGTFGSHTKKNFSVTLNYPTQDATNPVAVITSPLNGEAVSGQVGIAANVTDDTGVSKVEFYAGATLLTTSTAPPYQTTWDTTQVANATYDIIIKAYDTANNLSVASETVLVSNGPIAPTPGTASINLTASPATVSAGGLVTVAVNIDSDTVVADGAKANISYDVTKLSFVGISYEGSPFDSSAPENVQSPGNIIIARYTGNPPGPAGSSKLATITFSALASSGTTTVSINRADSFVGDHANNGADAISFVNNAIILFL